MDTIVQHSGEGSAKFALGGFFWGLVIASFFAGQYFDFPILPRVILAAVLLLINFLLNRFHSRPRAPFLGIDEDAVHWRIGGDANSVVAKRIPLNSIHSLKIVTAPTTNGTTDPVINLYFVLRDGSELPLPRELAPEMNRARIEEALHARMTNLRTQEITAAFSA